MFFIRFITQVSAFWAIGIWIVFQLINGLGMLGGAEAGGVAYGAHLGGFIGAVYCLLNFFYPAEAKLKNFSFSNCGYCIGNRTILNHQNKFYVIRFHFYAQCFRHEYRQV